MNRAAPHYAKGITDNVFTEISTSKARGHGHVHSHTHVSRAPHS